MSAFTTSLSNVLQVLDWVITQETTTNKRIGKEEVKLSPNANDLILHIENPKEYTKKLLELILARLQETHIEASIVFLQTHNK